MTNDRITQDEFLEGVQKQRSLIRKLLAGERRRTEVLTELARQRYGWMIGKFFNAGSDSWWRVSQDSICCIKDIKASAKNVFNDEVHLHMEYQVVEPRIEYGVMVNLNCHTEKCYFNHDEDLEALMAQKWVGWEVADEQMFRRYEQMRQSYGLRKYDRLVIALDKIASLQAALAAKDEAHRAEMEGMIRWNGKTESHLHKRLCEDGADLIREERRRQIEVEGYDTMHDRHHTPQVLCRAAVGYALHEDPSKLVADAAANLWPWTRDFWKPKDQLRNLVRAGALIAAAIDRLQYDQE